MTNFELKPKTSGWLRTLIFGKKTKIPSRKRVHCNHCVNNQGTNKDQTVQTNVSDERDDTDTSKENTYCDAKILQKYEECEGKTFSVQQIGNGGLRIYFCIGNSGKTHISRANKVKTVKNEKISDTFLELDNGSISHVSEAKISPIIIPNKSHQSLVSMNNENVLQSNVDLKERELLFSETNPVENIQQYECGQSEPMKSGLISVTPSSEGNVSEQEGGSLELNKSQLQPVLEPSTPKQASPTYLRSYENIAEKQQLRLTEIDEYKAESVPRKNLKNQDESGTEESNISKEYDLCQQNKLKRKSLMKSKSGLSRNSFTSMRKKRESYVVTMIPEIISKLENIEEKLNELEKVQEDKGKKIIKTERNSFNYAESAFSSDLENLDTGKHFCLKDPSSYKKAFSQFKPPKTNSNKVHPVLVKSCGEEVYINALQSVCVVKKMKSKQEITGDKKLVYHNTQELDAHNIASKSISKISSIKSMNSKLAKQYTKKPKSDMWRRISEELKYEMKY